MPSRLTVSLVELKSLLEHVDANGQLSYADLQGIITLDPDTKNRYFIGDNGETVSVSEAIALALSQTVGHETDSATISDTDPVLEFDLGKADSVAMSESIAYLITTVRDLTDSMNLTESAALLLSRTLSDSFGLDDTLVADSPAFLLNKNKTNIFSMTEAHAMSFSKALADSYSLTESAAMSLSTAISDTATMSESAVVVLIPPETSTLNGSVINEFTLNS